MACRTLLFGGAAGPDILGKRAGAIHAGTAVLDGLRTDAGRRPENPSFGQRRPPETPGADGSDGIRAVRETQRRGIVRVVGLAARHLGRPVGDTRRAGFQARALAS